MKPEDPLHERLREFKVTPETAPAFRAEVWQRIDAGRDSASVPGLNPLRLGLAGLACVLVLGVSGWTGHTRARSQNLSEREALATHYLQSLDARSLAHSEQ